MRLPHRLPRLHKTTVHLLTIAAIGISLWTEGHAKTADWLFVALSVMCEIH